MMAMPLSGWMAGKEVTAVFNRIGAVIGFCVTESEVCSNFPSASRVVGRFVRCTLKTNARSFPTDGGCFLLRLCCTASLAQTAGRCSCRRNDDSAVEMNRY
jgi:hypothetical protein